MPGGAGVSTGVTPCLSEGEAILLFSPGLPVGITGVLGTPLENDANCGVDTTLLERGDGAEEGVTLDDGLDWSELEEVGVERAFTGEVGVLRISGTGRLKASARATAMAEALGKRAAGFLARLRRMTAARAGGIFRLMRSGEVGIKSICCLIRAAGFFSQNGNTPVQIS